MLADMIKSSTQITGIFGHPVAQTKSPFMHNTAFEITDSDFAYFAFDVHPRVLKESVKSIQTLGFRGINVTIPHKETILPFLSKLSEEAAIIGAVNTIVNDVGTLIGYNTDVYGVLETLNPFKEEIKGSEITVIGAGGAARCIIYALVRYFQPAVINIANRNGQRADYLKDYFDTKMNYQNVEVLPLFPPDLVHTLRRSKLVINSTPMGMFPDVEDCFTSIPDSFFSGQIVFDLIYNPIETKLLKMAREQGATTLNGFKMFLYQGAKAFEMWTSKEFPLEKIESMLLKTLV